jgi:hypothetical protein
MVKVVLYFAQIKTETIRPWVLYLHRSRYNSQCSQQRFNAVWDRHR